MLGTRVMFVVVVEIAQSGVEVERFSLVVGWILKFGILGGGSQVVLSVLQVFPLVAFEERPMDKISFDDVLAYFFMNWV